jgi:hypothetical protein
MMLRIAWRSLITRPVRTAVLAGGFGFGIAVMADLLGVGFVMLEQIHAPALLGGGDVVVTGPFGSVPSARFVRTAVLGGPDMASRIVAVSPSTETRLFLIAPTGRIPVTAHGGIPSLERAIGDAEVSRVEAWADAAGDRRWSDPQPGDILRAMDRFHRPPDAPAYESSWAEWLYFNGRASDGRVRLYLTFLVGPRAATGGKRTAGVRLQLERDGQSRNYAAQGEVDEASVLANAPDVEVAGNRVRLRGLQYELTLRLSEENAGDPVTGTLVLDVPPGRSLPPATIRGANGWITGYAVPALSGTFSGELRVGRDAIRLDGAAGYHDHNWGFWRGVTWQWGQVAHDDLSIVYGRVFPPADVADTTRLPGFLAVLGPQGPLGFSTDVAIDDSDLRHVEVNARGRGLRLRATLSVDETVRTAMAMTRVPGEATATFMQLAGSYHVFGRVAERSIEFTARGAAETFRR